MRPRALAFILPATGPNHLFKGRSPGIRPFVFPNDASFLGCPTSRLMVLRRTAGALIRVALDPCGACHRRELGGSSPRLPSAPKCIGRPGVFPSVPLGVGLEVSSRPGFNLDLVYRVSVQFPVLGHPRRSAFEPSPSAIGLPHNFRSVCLLAEGPLTDGEPSVKRSHLPAGSRADYQGSKSKDRGRFGLSAFDFH